MKKISLRGRASRLRVLVLMAATIALAAASSTPARSVRVTEADSEHALKLAPGDTLVVSLNSTPGTGYSWKVARIDAQVLRQADQPELIHRANPMPGAPATQVFRFIAAGAGATSLELDYVRPWEHGTPPARTFHLTVTVR